jgi:hypothetical protein
MEQFRWQSSQGSAQQRPIREPFAAWWIARWENSSVDTVVGCASPPLGLRRVPAFLLVEKISCKE